MSEGGKCQEQDYSFQVFVTIQHLVYANRVGSKNPGSVISCCGIRRGGPTGLNLISLRRAVRVCPPA